MEQLGARQRNESPIWVAEDSILLSQMIRTALTKAGYTNLSMFPNGAELWEALEARDPASAAVIHPNNVRRVVRAFELLEEGASYAEQKQRLATVAPFVPAVQFGLAVEPAILNERIDARVDAMVAAGLVDEVRGLLTAGFRDGVTAPQAIGYKEIVEALDGNTTLEEAVKAIKTATRRYGKRQRTWFRRDRRIRWVNADAGDAEAVAAEILSQLETLDAYHG